MFYDNFRKRRILNNFLYNYDFEDRKILEIGTGTGVTAAILRLSYGNLDYTGVDISSEFITMVRKMFKLNMKLGNITSIPVEDKIFEDIFLFDILEHIPPDEREISYRELNRVIKNEGRIFLNSPSDIQESQHNKKFEFGFFSEDLLCLMKVVNMQLLEFKNYYVKIGKFINHYNFIVMSK